MPVYFIQNERGDVKIGHSNNPVKRLTSLRAGTPGRLVLVRAIEGEAETERQMHKHFAECHIRGEWFKFHDDMLTIGVPARLFKEAPQRTGPLITHADIMALWPRITHLAADLKVPYGRAHKWTKREYIDPVYWDDLILFAAKRFNVVISHQQLTQGAALVRGRKAA